MNKCIKTFRDIIAWQKAYDLTLKIYKYTNKFPKNEEFGLRSQIRRASISIISNIAEGYKRNGKKDRIKFYNQAETSLEEVKTQSLISYDLDYFKTKEYQDLNEMQDEAGRVLNGWIQSQ